MKLPPQAEKRLFKKFGLDRMNYLDTEAKRSEAMVRLTKMGIVKETGEFRISKLRDRPSMEMVELLARNGIYIEPVYDIDEERLEKITGPLDINTEGVKCITSQDLHKYLRKFGQKTAISNIKNFLKKHNGFDDITTAFNTWLVEN